MKLSVTQLNPDIGVNSAAQGGVTITLALPGTIGGGPTTFSFVQTSPSASWSIGHNLDRFPAVDVVDSSGRLVEGDVTYVSSNLITVTFSGGFAGTAYLN